MLRVVVDMDARAHVAAANTAAPPTRRVGKRARDEGARSELYLAIQVAIDKLSPDEQGALVESLQKEDGQRKLRAMREQYPNHNKPWSDPHRERVMSMFMDNAAYEAIGAEMGRTAHACTLAVEKGLQKEMKLNGLTVQQLAERYHRSVDDMHAAMNVNQHGNIA
jgi:hypothetical protein